MENQQTPLGDNSQTPPTPPMPPNQPERSWRPPIERAMYDPQARPAEQPAPAPQTFSPQPQPQPAPDQFAAPVQQPGQPDPQAAQTPETPQYRFGEPGPGQHPSPLPAKPVALLEEGASKKKFAVAWLLSFFLGGLGADRFYLGRYGTAVAKLLTFGGFGVWGIIDFARLGFGKTTDKHGLPLAGYRQNAAKFKKITLIALGLYVLLFIVWLVMLIMFAAVPSLQANAKNTTRKNDISNLANSLNEYYATNKNYPTLSTMNNPDFTSQKGGFSIASLHDPDWTQKDTACTGSNGQPLIGALASPHCYVYEPGTSNGSNCDNITLKCTQATLTAFPRGSNAFVLRIENGQ